MIVLLGSLRRNASGITPSVDVENLYRTIVARRSTLDAGDLGLLLWAEARMGVDEAMKTIAMLDRISRDTTSLARLEGMKAAWFAIGTVHAVAAGFPAHVLADRAVLHLQSRKSQLSPRSDTLPLGVAERFFPTSQQRSTHCWRCVKWRAPTWLATRRATPSGLPTNSEELRLPDAGWPWLFHSDRAVVVEP